MQFAYGEAEFGCGPQCFEEKHFDAVRSKYIGGGFCKKAAVVAAVVANGHAYFSRSVSLFEVIGKALCSHTHRVFVHPVGAYSHDTTETAGTKFKAPVKRIGQVIGVGGLQ